MKRKPTASVQCIVRELESDPRFLGTNSSANATALSEFLNGLFGQIYLYFLVRISFTAINICI